MFTTSHKELYTVFKALSASMSTEAVRPHLCGINVEFKDGVLTLTATNGNILISHVVHWKVMAQEPFNYIIPASIVKNVLNTKPTKDSAYNPVTFRVADNEITVSYFNVEFKSNLEGLQYPDYRRVVPDFTNNQTVKVILNSALLKQLGEAIALINNIKIPVVELEININEPKNPIKITNCKDTTCLIMPTKL